MSTPPVAMISPFADVRDQIAYFFPGDSHPYRQLERYVDALLRPDMAVLDIGCGHGAPNLAKLRGLARELHGIDLVNFDPHDGDLNLRNESVTDLRSFADQSINLAYSRSVMEHVEDVEAAFREIYRVLAPGAHYVFLTPNRYDYASLIATAVPNRLHGRIVKWTEGRGEVDTFPTYYRANSFRSIRRLADGAGFSVVRLERLNQYPSYFSFNRPLFWLGSLYEKVLDRTPWLDALKGWIFCVLQRPSPGVASALRHGG